MSSNPMEWTGGLNPVEFPAWEESYPFDRPWYEQPVAHRSAVACRIYPFSKRLVDLCVAAFAMVVVLPIIAVAGLAIRIDSPGPVVFSQLRTGKNGRRFRMYKLRTMSHDAELQKERYRHLNELRWPDFKISKDPRVTRVGRFLRRTSIDELPQFFNVLVGDMSVVGPRPTSFASERYRLWHTERLHGKPGLTGLWQVSGRNELEFDERVRLDIAYLRNASLSLDFRILLRTFGAVLSGRGAN